MFKKISLFIYLLKQNGELKEKIKDLESRPATFIIEKLLEKKISWYDYKELDFYGRREYYHNAQSILDNPVFKNEIQHILSNTIKHIAEKSKNHEETQGNRMSINGLKVLQERFESIEKPETQEKTKDNLHDVI